MQPYRSLRLAGSGGPSGRYASPAARSAPRSGELHGWPWPDTKLLAFVARPFERDDWNFARRFLLIFSIRWEDIHRFLKRPGTLSAREDSGGRLELLLPDFNRHHRMSQHIEVSLGILDRTALRGHR